jgi:hypothetical protein
LGNWSREGDWEKFGMGGNEGRKFLRIHLQNEPTYNLDDCGKKGSITLRLICWGAC